MHVQRIIWYDLEVSICLAHSMAHSMLPDVTMSQWFDCQAPRAPRAPAPSLPRLVTASAPQHVTEQPGKDQDISGTPQNTWGGRMQQMEKAWVMAGELMLIMDSKHQVSYIPTFFLSRKSRMERMYTMLKIDYLNSRPTTINLSKPCLMCFSCFSDASRYKGLVARKMNPKTRSPWSVFPLWTDAFFATEL